MVRRSRGDLDAVFAALSDPTRRAILARLSAGEASVGELAEPHDMSLAAVSRHLQVLSDAGLMVRVRDGRSIRCRLAAGPLAEANDWLARYQRFWDGSLDQLGRFLEGGRD